MCDHEAEDGYQLDAHIWTQHEDDDQSTFIFHCVQCDKKSQHGCGKWAPKPHLNP